jgi:hypothetical protein
MPQSPGNQLFSRADLAGMQLLIYLLRINSSRMNQLKMPIAIVSLGIVIFLFLCKSSLQIPTAFLFGMLVLIQAGLIWLLVSLFRNNNMLGKNS